jgi:uncharacterized protein YbcI
LVLIWNFSHAESEKVASHFCNHLVDFQMQNGLTKTECFLVRVSEKQTLVSLEIENFSEIEIYSLALKPQKKMESNEWLQFKTKNTLFEFKHS